MAARSCASLVTLAALSPTARSVNVPGCAACSKASRCNGTLVGEVMVAAAPGTKLNPVITPPVLTVTSAVACCHHGFLTERTGTTSPLRRLQSCLRRPVSAGGAPFARLLPGRGQAVENGLHLGVAWVGGVLEQHPGLRGDLRGRAAHPLLEG